MTIILVLSSMVLTYVALRTAKRIRQYFRFVHETGIVFSYRGINIMIMHESDCAEIRKLAKLGQKSTKIAKENESMKRYISRIEQDTKNLVKSLNAKPTRQNARAK